MEQARHWLPRIKELGEATFNNDTAQLSFFSLSEDINASNNLALVIQRALLNDCPNINQEALCAVSRVKSVPLELYDRAVPAVDSPCFLATLRL